MVVCHFTFLQWLCISLKVIFEVQLQLLICDPIAMVASWFQIFVCLYNMSVCMCIYYSLARSSKIYPLWFSYKGMPNSQKSFLCAIDISGTMESRGSYDPMSRIVCSSAWSCLRAFCFSSKSKIAILKSLGI